MNPDEIADLLAVEPPLSDMVYQLSEYMLKILGIVNDLSLNVAKLQSEVDNLKATRIG